MSDATDSRRPWIVIAVFGALGSLAIWRYLVAPEPIGGDASQYLAHAWALVEGRPYGDTGYLYRPEAWLVGPPLQPPGLPLVLAPLLAVFGRYSVAPVVLMYLLWGAFLLLTFARLAGTEPIEDAAGATLVAGAALVLHDAPASVGSDFGFMALVWATIWLADRGGRAWTTPPPAASAGATSGPAPLRTVLAGLTGAGAFAFRLAAIPLIPAAALWVAVAGRGRRLARSWLIVALVWAVVFAGLYFGVGTGRTPGTDLDTLPTVVDTGGELVGVGPVGRVVHNVTIYRYAALEASLYPLPAGWPSRAYHVLALVLVIIGLGAWIRASYRTFLASFVLATGGFLVFSPVAEGRYLWVLYPLVGLGLVRGLRLGAGWLGIRRTGGAALGIVTLLTLLAAAERARRPPPAYAAESKETLWRWAGALVLEDAGPEEVRVVSNRPRHLAWYADVPAAYLSPRDTIELRGMRPTHIVFDRHAFEGDGSPGVAFPDPDRLGVVLGERGPLVVIRRER